MIRTICILFSCCTSLLLHAQLPAVYGTVAGAQDHEKIQGAIVADSQALTSTYSNKDGYYLLGLNSGSRRITISAAGYHPQQVTVSAYAPIELHVELLPLDYDQDDTNSNIQHALFDYRSSHISPGIIQFKHMPALLCEPDPNKFLQYLPGVNGGIEGLAGLYVRGGNYDQNLVTMDGLPLYGNGHVFGFLSNFNPDLVRDIQFYRGAAPARYGGRASSVADISTKDGNVKDWNGNFSVNIINFNINANGPVSKDGRTTLSLGARRSWLDLLLPKSGDNFFYYNFHDLNAKLVHRINKTDKIAVWIYNGRDKFKFHSTQEFTDSSNRLINETTDLGITYQNTLSGLNYSKLFGRNLYANFGLGMSRYSYNYPIEFSQTIVNDSQSSKAIYNGIRNNSITDFSARADFEYRLRQSSFRFGIDAIYHALSPTIESIKVRRNGVTTFDKLQGEENKQAAQEASAYLELESNLGPGLSLNTGLRLWTFLSVDQTYIRPEPRIFLKQIFNGVSALKLGFSMMNQGVHQLAGIGAALPSSVWFPSSGKIRPQQSTQLTLGYYKPLILGLEFSADLYYKWLDGITDLTGQGDNGFGPNYWEDMLAQGKGTSYGLEFMLMKKFGKLNGLASYSLAHTDRTIPDINFGKTFPFTWDRRHKFAGQLVWNALPDWRFNLGFVFMSGNAVSVPTSKYVAANGTIVLNYTEKNNFRMPFYKRIDIGFVHEINYFGTEGARQFWGVNIYNMTNSLNPLVVFLDTGDKGNLGKVRVMGQSYFPIIPSAFYRIEF